MRRRVGVEETLENVGQYLKGHGYQVETLRNNSDLENYDALVISGQDDNFMGMNTTLTKSPVIDATGKTPESIYSELQRTIK